MSSQQCSADYNINIPCCGQPSTDSDYSKDIWKGHLRAQLKRCPSDKPKCSGYVANSHYGNCVMGQNQLVQNLKDKNKALNTQLVQDTSTLAAQQTKISTLNTNLITDETTIENQNKTIQDQLNHISGLESETRELSRDLTTTEEQLDETRSLGTILALSQKLSSRGVGDMSEPLRSISLDQGVISNLSLNMSNQQESIQNINNNVLKTSDILKNINSDQELFEKEQKQILIDTRRGMLVNEHKRNTYNTKLIMFIISLNIVLLIFIAIMYVRYMRS